MSSVFLEDISSKKGLAQVMVFAWEFKDEACDFKKKKRRQTTSWLFKGKIETLFQVPR